MWLAGPLKEAKAQGRLEAGQSLRAWSGRCRGPRGHGGGSPAPVPCLLGGDWPVQPEPLVRRRVRTRGSEGAGAQTEVGVSLEEACPGREGVLQAADEAPRENCSSRGAAVSPSRERTTGARNPRCCVGRAVPQPQHRCRPARRPARPWPGAHTGYC